MTGSLDYGETKRISFLKNKNIFTGSTSADGFSIFTVALPILLKSSLKATKGSAIQMEKFLSSDVNLSGRGRKR